MEGCKPSRRSFICQPGVVSVWRDIVWILTLLRGETCTSEHLHEDVNALADLIPSVEHFKWVLNGPSVPQTSWLLCQPSALSPLESRVRWLYILHCFFPPFTLEWISRIIWEGPLSSPSHPLFPSFHCSFLSLFLFLHLSCLTLCLYCPLSPSPCLL